MHDGTSTAANPAARHAVRTAPARSAACSTIADCGSARRWRSSSPSRCRCSSTSSSGRSTISASTSSVVLRQLSQETVDAAADDVEDALKRPHISVLLAVPQARTDAMDLPAMDAAFRQGLEESPFVEAFYVWSSAARERQAGTMFVYNRDSLADVSGDLDLRFRDAPGVAAVVLPRLQQLLGAQAGDRRLPGDHRRAQEVRAGAAALPQRRPGREISSFVALVVDAADLRAVHLPALMKSRLASVQHLGGFPQLDLTLRDPVGQVIFSSAPPRRLDLRRRAQLPAGVLRSRAARVHRAVRGRARDLDAADRLRQPHHRRDRRGQQPSAAGADDHPGAGDGRRRAVRGRGRRRAKCGWPS